MPENRFFVTFDNANPIHHSNQFRGYWGNPVAVSTWRRDGSKYVNTIIGRNHDRIALNISQEIEQRVYDKFRIDRISDLIGKHVLAFGSPYQTSGGQFTLYVRNPAHMAVIDPARLAAN